MLAYHKRNRYTCLIMAQSPDSYEADKFFISPRLIVPAVLVASALMIMGFHSGLTFSNDAMVVYCFIGSIAIFALSHLWPALKFVTAHTFYLCAYHLVLGLALIFIVPTNSIFLYLWILLLYVAEFIYQAKGVFLSTLALLATIVLGNFYQHNVLNKDLLLEMIAEFIIIVLISSVITSMAFGNRKERREIQEKIVKAEFEHSRLLALINSMSDGVIATDQDGKIINYNAAALDILNTNKTLTGKPIGEFLKTIDQNDQTVDIVELARHTNYIQRRSDLYINIGDDEKISLDINISQIAKSAILAKQKGYMFLLRDITLQKSLDEERDLFISEVSHELRTPLTITEGEMSMASLLIDKPGVSKKEIKESVEKAHDQIIFLEDMVNDLSALSRAQRDDKSMEIESFTVEEVLSELQETYGPQAKEKGLYLKIDIAPSTPSLATSRLYFKEILQNFITNAIKYTEGGGVTVMGQAVDKNHVLISVTDTGAGIAKSEQSKVYQKFWRSEDPYTRSTGGTGLGLFITSKLAHRIGAELRLQSKLKQGSTFSILLPVKAVNDVDQGNVVKDEIAHLF